MSVDLVERAMQMALNLRQPTKVLIFHSDRGSQYTSHRFQQQLKNNNITASMSGRGSCLDNPVVERFFSRLKNEWLLNIYHLTRNDMREDVEAYIRYYNQIRFHTSNGDCSPIEFEQSTIKVSYAACSVLFNSISCSTIVSRPLTTGLCFQNVGQFKFHRKLMQIVRSVSQWQYCSMGILARIFRSV
jgi:hypothetical protein